MYIYIIFRLILDSIQQQTGDFSTQYYCFCMHHRNLPGKLYNPLAAYLKKIFYSLKCKEYITIYQLYLYIIIYQLYFYIYFFFRRVDHFILSERIKKNVCDIILRKTVYGSTHCPLTLFINIQIIYKQSILCVQFFECVFTTCLKTSRRFYLATDFLG